MASLHEIKAHIANVEATKKTTRAMYLISASKAQKAKAQLDGAFPYFQQIKQTLAEVLACSVNLDTPYIREEAENAAGTAPGRNLYVVLGADRGMAGAYGHNILGFVGQYADKAADELIVAGFMSRAHLRGAGYAVNAGVSVAVMNPSAHRVRDVADLVMDKYLSGQCRSAYVIYTELVSSLKQQPAILQLLPLDTAALYDKPVARRDEIEYLPNAHEVFAHLVPHYLKGILYAAFVEAFASEQSARMYAMDGATKSAGETIERLSVSYNRARQAKITQELTEIIGGIPQA